jgi:hypothetical protein
VSFRPGGEIALANPKCQHLHAVERHKIIRFQIAMRAPARQLDTTNALIVPRSTQLLPFTRSMNIFTMWDRWRLGSRGDRLAEKTPMAVDC